MKEYLISHAALMNTVMSPLQADRFARYHAMLERANRDINLTAISADVSEACDRNYLDSLTLLKHLSRATSLIDVGSGAGFPGIPLAIMRDDLRVVLLDALKKRVEFLTEVISALGLNAQAVHLRCEDAARRPEYRDRFDAATSRAVAGMNVLSEWLLPFVKQGGYMYALKGANAQEEIGEAAGALKALNGRLTGVYDAPIPGRDWRHCIVAVEKCAPTPERFPRKSGIAAKRPIKNEV